MAGEHAARADLGGDVEGLRARDEEVVDTERGRPETRRDRDGFFPADGVGHQEVEPRDAAGLSGGMGGAESRSGAAGGDGA